MLISQSNICENYNFLSKLQILISTKYTTITSATEASAKHYSDDNQAAHHMLRPFFFDYLVYGSADPILQDFEKKKTIKLDIFSI